MKKVASVDEEKMQAEIETRLEQMETPGWRFPRRFKKWDYALAGLLAAVCFGMLLWGAWL